MAFVFAVVALVVVLGVAAYFVAREQSLPSKHEVAKEFDPEQCALEIFEALSAEGKERLGLSGAREIVSWVFDYMKLAGAVANGDDSVPGPRTTVVLGSATSVQYIVERADGAGLEVSSSDALAAVGATIEYLSRIGAIGPSVSEKEVG
ncbi:MAG: hypothetical protein C4318_04065 [Acidimicrobiia bacterium]